MNYTKKSGLTNRFPKGNRSYADWLQSLTPEQYEEHLAARRRKKAMRVAMAKVADEYQAEWIAALNNAASTVLAKAIEDGNPAAFAVVWDRIIGKPDLKVDVSNEDRALPFNDDLLGD